MNTNTRSQGAENVGLCRSFGVVTISVIALSPEMRPGYTTMNQSQSGSLW
jgi:hypothetical protein